jgi:hypothetical protein
MHTHTYTRSSYFVTRARAQAKARERGKGRKSKRNEEKKEGEKERKKIFARTTSGDDLREQIDRDAFAMRSYACYMLRGGRRRMRERKEKQKNGHVHYLLKQKLFTKSPDFIGQCF